VNREQRRHPEKVEQKLEQTENHQDPAKAPADEMLAPDRTQDDFSVRAKNAGHGKKTADKWNQ
jgi:hypothetical protein